MSQQLDLFEKEILKSEPKNKAHKNKLSKNQLNKPNWFSLALSDLEINQASGWPDVFGRSVQKALVKTGHKPIKTLSLFSGGGGLDIGFHDVGFNVVEMVEIEEKFCESLIVNAGANGYFSNKPKVVCTDIRKYKGDLANIDFIIGGPPCQTFSAAGRRAAGIQGIDDPRGTLFEEYVRLLKKIKPKGFLFENVYGIIGAQNGKAWQTIVKSFEEIGYNIFYRILDTADFGVPQHRERLIIVGLKKGTFRFPRPSHGPDSADGMDYYNAGQALDDLTKTQDKPLAGKFGYLLEKIPPGLNYSFFTSEMGHPEPVFAWRSKFSDFLYKADPKRPVRTIKAQGGQYTGPFSWENRKFTIEEHKRLQTFPDAYILKGGRQIAIKQIGNSVPPQFARILGLAILDQVFNVKLPFKIDYLNFAEELGFRQRKRLLTKLYQDTANIEIEKILSAKDVRPRKKSATTSTRFFNANTFFWGSKKSSESDIAFNVSSSKTKSAVKIKVKEKSVKSKVLITIEISPCGGKSVLDRPIIVLLNATTLNAGFRAAEEYIRENFGMADLVQLSGYYQYQPKILIKMYAKKIFNNLDTINVALFVNELIEKGLVAKQTPINILAKQLGKSEEVVIQLLHKMKKMGFEVRSSNTNPQIPEDSFIVPYAFPSLNPQSVQLRKDL